MATLPKTRFVTHEEWLEMPRAEGREEDGCFHPAQQRKTSGVPEAWGISPEAATVEVLTLESGQLRRTALLGEGILKPQAFPRVQVGIARIWPD